MDTDEHGWEELYVTWASRPCSVRPEFQGNYAANAFAYLCPSVFICGDKHPFFFAPFAASRFSQMMMGYA
jgi:hypothetical protein